MLLLKVELWNFRCHEHFAFTPDREGITSISGNNGSGKSSIVDGLAWALYGTKPNGVKNKLLIRKDVSVKEDPAKVEVTLEIGKTEYLIRRSFVSDTGAVDCNVYGRPSGTDGELNHLAGPAVSSAEVFIRKLLSMDERGFLTSTFIQQKQVDQIITSSAKERAEIIEKLTGIQSISNGISLAKEEAKGFQKAASVITLEDTDSIKATMEEVKEEGIALKVENDRISSLIKEEEITLSESRKNREVMEDKVREGISLRGALELNGEREKMALYELKRNEEIVLSHKRESKTTRVTSADELSNTAQSIQSDLSRVNVALEREQEEVSRLTQVLSDSPRKEEKVALLVRAETLREEVGRLEGELVKGRSKVSTLRGEQNQIKKSIDTLGTDAHECPVCKSNIKDPEALHSNLKDEANELKERERELIQKGISDKATLETTQGELSEVEKKLTLLIELEGLRNKLEESKATLVTLREKSQELTVRYKVAQDAYIEAVKLQSKAEEVKRAKSALLENQRTIDSLSVEKTSLLDRLEQLNPPSERELRALSKSVDSEENNLTNLKTQLGRQEEQLKATRVRYIDLKARYDSAVKANEKYYVIMDGMKQANVATTLLTQFKTERIEQSIPQLEMYSSSILDKFTDGKFIGVSLGAKFTPMVTLSSGEVRSVAQLSGGELSSVAIALRVGISMLLTQRESSFLILDEILVSMDAGRARHIVEAISAITTCQVIFIAHNPDIQEIADKTVSIG